MYRTTLPVTLTQPCSDKWCHTNCADLSAEKSCGTLQAQLLSSSQVPGVPRLAQMSSQTVLPSSSTCCCSFSPRLFPFLLSKGRWIHLLCTSEKEKGKLKWYIHGRGRRRKFAELMVNDPKKAGCWAVHSVPSLLHHWKQVLLSVWFLWKDAAGGLSS